MRSTMKHVLKKMIVQSVRNYWLFVFIILTACSSSLNTESMHKAKPEIPSKKNNITAINPITYNHAYNDFHDRAVKGDPIAQNNLGHMYADGRGVEQDTEEALKWYLKAANQGNTHAMVNLGMAYLYGHGVSSNKKRACKYFEKAGVRGDKEGKEFSQTYCIV